MKVKHVENESDFFGGSIKWEIDMVPEQYGPGDEPLDFSPICACNIFETCYSLSWITALWCKLNDHICLVSSPFKYRAAKVSNELKKSFEIILIFSIKLQKSVASYFSNFAAGK